MRWQVTPALGRSVLVGAVSTAVAVLLGAPAMAIMAGPFVLYAVLALRHRPDGIDPAPQRLRAEIDHRSLHEGQGTTSRLSVGTLTGVEHVVRAMNPTSHVAFGPVSGVAGGVVDGASSTAGSRGVPVVEIGARRWGLRTLGGEQVALTAPWAGYRLGPVGLEGTPVRVLPGGPGFTSRAPAPRPVGLVGAHRSPRLGASTEFADIRPFRAGDRLRRISWRVSARTGELHVTTSPAEQDTGVLLVVDALVDHGRSGGVDGAASSLDRGVRAATALADYYTRSGDRVALRVVGGDGGLVAPGSGTRHLRILRDTLAGVRPGGLPAGITNRIRLYVRGGNLVFVLSAMLDPAIVTATASLARRGLPVIVVDTLPADVSPDVPEGVDPAVGQLAWRMRTLERDRVLASLAALGCPVVGWRGPGSLDEVLLRLARQSRAPSIGRASAGFGGSDS